MGWERNLGGKIVKLYHGQEIEWGGKGEGWLEGELVYGTPNMKALFRALYLGWAYRHGDHSDLSRAIQECETFCVHQEEFGHMALRAAKQVSRGKTPPNEMLVTGDYYPVWLLAMSYMYYVALQVEATSKAPIALNLLKHLRYWWNVEADLLKLHSCPDSRVVSPAARAKQKVACPNPVRDDAARILAGTKEQGRYKDTDQGGLGVILLKEVRRDLVKKLEPVPAYKMFDRLVVRRYRYGHTSWCPMGMRALLPVEACGVDYRSGEMWWEIREQVDLGELLEEKIIYAHDE